VRARLALPIDYWRLPVADSWHSRRRCATRSSSPCVSIRLLPLAGPRKGQACLIGGIAFTSAGALLALSPTLILCLFARSEQTGGSATARATALAAAVPFHPRAGASTSATTPEGECDTAACPCADSGRRSGRAGIWLEVWLKAGFSQGGPVPCPRCPLLAPRGHLAQVGRAPSFSLDVTDLPGYITATPAPGAGPSRHADGTSTHHPTLCPDTPTSVSVRTQIQGRLSPSPAAAIRGAATPGMHDPRTLS
jgi:hypothetical protein